MPYIIVQPRTGLTTNANIEGTAVAVTWPKPTPEMAANAGKLFEDARSAYKLARLSRGIGEVIFQALNR